MDLLLFFVVLHLTRKKIHSYEDVTITGKGFLILTYTRHSWSMNKKGSLECLSYCDTGHPFIHGEKFLSASRVYEVLRDNITFFLFQSSDKMKSMNKVYS